MQLFGAVMLVVFAWECYHKFTSDEPVDQDWGTHIRFTVLATIFALGGLLLIVTGGPGGSILNRLLGGVGLILGTLMLFAADRDYKRWKASDGR